MEFFSQTYVALRGPTGAPQTAQDTIGRLSDRLSPSTLLADRRAAVLSLKGLSRDCKQDVGERALTGLLEVLENDADIDGDIAKAVLETLNVLCDTEEGKAKELAFKHTDQVLATDKPTHKLCALLGDTAFYVRYATLQLLGTLLQNRRQLVQAYFLKAQAGPAGVISVLEDKREIIRNEAMVMVQSLISQSADIQKVLAFEGAFEKLFNTVKLENGVEGGVVVHDALACVDGLLRFNVSNQSYFRETELPPLLCALLQFPPSLPPHEPAPQEFALQFWEPQKTKNVGLIVGVVGMLVNSKGGTPQETAAFSRLLIELSLASNAPTSLKTQAMRLLPPTFTVPLTALMLTPYMPVPETNGEEWDRLEPTSALDVLVELVLNGEYNGVFGGVRSKDVLELRCAGLDVFENFVRTDETHEAIVAAMLPPEDGQAPPPITPLLHALIAPPTAPLDGAAVMSTHFAALLFAHLLRGAPKAKALACRVFPPTVSAHDTGAFFVPADGGAPPPPPVPEEEDEPQSLIQILSDHLALAFLERARADTSDGEKREWDRLVVGYSCVLSEWMWEDPRSVRLFLEAGALGMLVEPINQTSEVDVVVPALCAFLLGICYEFNREPGEVTRSTIHPILTRLGVDTLVGRMTRFREDERFKAISPEAIVLPYPTPAHAYAALRGESADEAEVWFDWAFVDFWKSNYYVIQRGIGTDPNAAAPSKDQSAETVMLVSSLREVIANQAQQLEALQKQLKDLAVAKDTEVSAAHAQISSLGEELAATAEKQKEAEKEQEDLLVLLDELSSKRRADKVRMRQAGMDVSEDEADDDDDEDEE